MIIFPAVQSADICPIKKDAAFGRIVQSANQLDKRCFSRAVQANDRQLFAGVDRQIDLVQYVFFRAGIPETDLIQFDFAWHPLPHWNRCTIFKEEGFGQIEIFPNGAQIQTLCAQGGEGGENSCYPLRKAARRGEIQKKFCGGQTAAKSHSDQI